MQTAFSETESKSLDLSICVHHYTLRAPCPKGQGIGFSCSLLAKSFFSNHAKGVVSSQSLRRCSHSAWSGGEARQPEFVGTKSTGFISRNAGIDDFHTGSNDHIVEIK